MSTTVNTTVNTTGPTVPVARKEYKRVPAVALSLSRDERTALTVFMKAHVRQVSKAGKEAVKAQKAEAKAAEKEGLKAAKAAEKAAEKES